MSGKIREKSGNFKVDDKWQPWNKWTCSIFGTKLELIIIDIELIDSWLRESRDSKVHNCKKKTKKLDPKKTKKKLDRF